MVYIEFVRINRFLSLYSKLSDRYNNIEMRVKVKFGPEDFDEIPTRLRKRK